jgi:hypothetical protein
MLLREEKDPSRTYLEKNGKSWLGVEDGKVYIVEVEEDSVEEAQRLKNSKPIQFYKPEENKSSTNARINGITN